MRRIIIIVFLSFVFFVSVCCESKKEVRMRHETELLQKQWQERSEKDRQRQVIYTRTSKPGRYEIFQDQLANKTFLLDTMDGRVWIIVEDKETKELVWQEVNVENRDTQSLEELFKNYK